MNRFRRERARLGLTQQELADRAGVGLVTISHLETGQRRNIRPTTLYKIAVALDVPVEELEGDAAHLDGRLSVTGS